MRFQDFRRAPHIVLTVLHTTRTRQGTSHPKCGIDLRLSPLPLDLQNVGVCRPTVLAIIKSRTCRYRRQVSVRLGEPQNTKEADHGAF